MRLVWDEDAWDQYVYWQHLDKNVLKRINLLIEDVQRNKYTGIGKPEALRYELSGWWSRRITEEHRLVYRIHEGQIEIASCKYHY